MDTNKERKIVIIAGEPSGDFLGARLMAALKDSTGGHSLQFYGVGGRGMKAEGLASFVPLSQLSVMGFFEVIGRLKNIIATYFYIKKKIIALGPDVVITIDFPGFNFFLGRALRRALGATPLIHYVAPTVWAWKKKRARKVAKFLTEVLALFPFEPPYFERHNLKCTFVGHPLVEMRLDQGDGKAFRKIHGIDAKDTVYILLPGSRLGEVKRHTPVFIQMLNILQQTVPRLHVVLPTLEGLVPEIRSLWKTDIPTTFITDVSQKKDAYAAADVAVAASGTIALELAAAGVPMVITYKVSALSAWLVKRLVSTRYFCMINILLRRNIVPELLQQDCTGSKLALESLKVLRNPQKRQQQKDAFKRVMQMLMAKEGLPSEAAAKAVLYYLNGASRSK